MSSEATTSKHAVHHETAWSTGSSSGPADRPNLYSLLFYFFAWNILQLCILTMGVFSSRPHFATDTRQCCRGTVNNRRGKSCGDEIGRHTVAGVAGLGWQPSTPYISSRMLVFYIYIYSRCLRVQG
jgi:hypothetical protein